MMVFVRKEQQKAPISVLDTHTGNRSTNGDGLAVQLEGTIMDPNTHNISIGSPIKTLYGVVQPNQNMVNC